MIQRSTSMKIFKIFFIFIIFNKVCYSLNSSCLPCSSHLCYQCYNTLPIDRTNIEKLYIICNTTNNLFQQQERFYSIIQSYTTINCSMKTLYLDQYTLWNYLEYMSITYANLTNLSPMIFNRSLLLLSSSSSSPILYSIKTLNLSYNSIRIINKNFSYYFPSLEKLDLSYNHIIHIKKKTFINLLYLKELYLNNNYLKQILPNIFPHQSLNLINLNMNYWHCSCTNILTLSIKSIYTIINLSSIISLQSSFTSINFTKFNTQNSTLLTSTIINIISSNKLSPFFLWLFNTSKNILPKYFQTSNKHVLIVWLILLIIAFIIFIFLIYLIYYHKKIYRQQSEKSHSFIHFDTNAYNYQTLFDVKFTCQNHKCLCQYHRRAHSTLYLTKSTSFDLLDKQTNSIQSPCMKSNQLRYAKIKQIPSLKKFDNDYLTGEFRTIVKLKTLPN
ncbi:unnamed protein product [Rotaria sordida]|uniref:Uncharacterized protein n=2 Tax=Rotaria sordida TaxID=392033 RepID=A0A814L8I1_9BILA|nr:unnamed protein product [Rotaria sordida]